MTGLRLRPAAADSGSGWDIIITIRPARLADPGLPWAVDSADPVRLEAVGLAVPAAAGPAVSAAWAAAEAMAAAVAAAADFLFWKKGKHTEARPVDEAARCAWRRAPIFASASLGAP